MLPLNALCVGFRWQRNQPLAFIDCQGQEERSALSSTAATGTSYFNSQEAEAVVKAVCQLLSAESTKLQASDIGVITPYSGQVCHRLP